QDWTSVRNRTLAFSRGNPASMVGALAAGQAMSGRPCRPHPMSEVALHEHQIEPAPELPPDLREPTGRLESEPLVHADRAGVVGVDAGDHDVLAAGGAPFEQDAHQRRADSQAALAVGDVDRV